jgi:hypothetical protein
MGPQRGGSPGPAGLCGLDDQSRLVNGSRPEGSDDDEGLALGQELCVQVRAEPCLSDVAAAAIEIR